MHREIQNLQKKLMLLDVDVKKQIQLTAAAKMEYE